MKRKYFNAQFKQDAVNQATQPGITKTHVAKTLGISAFTLSRWIKEQQGPSTVKTDASISKTDYERLYIDLERVTHERNVLKAAITLFLADMK
jgi:transposase